MVTAKRHRNCLRCLHPQTCCLKRVSSTIKQTSSSHNHIKFTRRGESHRFNVNSVFSFTFSPHQIKPLRRVSASLCPIISLSPINISCWEFMSGFWLFRTAQLKHDCRKTQNIGLNKPGWRVTISRTKPAYEITSAPILPGWLRNFGLKLPFKEVKKSWFNRS